MPIVAQKLTHEYSQGGLGVTHALKAVDLTIPDGCVFGIIGHTGSGKTTLIQHFNGLLQPLSGTLSVDGLDAAEKKNRPLIRKKVGMVFQYPEYQLFEETVYKDIAFGPANYGVSGEALEAAVLSAMELVDLPPEQFAHKSPFELSGGEKRRVALAGVLSMQPDYLVMDEPMAGMDPQGRESLMDLIKRLRSLGRTIVVVSHHMDEIAAISDEVAVMSEGEIVMTGSPRRVFADIEGLNRLSLDAPFATQIVRKLNARGFGLPEGLITVEEAAQAIADRLKIARPEVPATC